MTCNNTIALAHKDLLTEHFGLGVQTSLRLEPTHRQHRVPGRAVQGWCALHPKRRVIIGPPPFEQAKSQVAEQRGLDQFVDHDHAATF